MPKITLKDTLSTIASLQQKLNMANGTVAELIKEVQTVKQYAKKVDAQNEILRESNATLHAEIETLKKDREIILSATLIMLTNVTKVFMIITKN